MKPNQTNVLTRARAIVANPDDWVQRTGAIDANGNKWLHCDDDNAVAWSTCAAIGKACHEQTTDNAQAIQLFRKMIARMRFGIPDAFRIKSVAFYNDSVESHTVILDWFDRVLGEIE